MKAAESGLFFLCCLLVYVAPTMAIGATQGNLPLKRSALLSTVFAAFQTVLTLLGWGLASWLEPVILTLNIENVKVYTLLILLTSMTAYMAFKMFYPEDFRETMQNTITIIKYAWLAIRWFVPVLIAGMVFGYSINMSILNVSLIFGGSFMMSLVGLAYGYWQGYKHTKIAYAAGGIILIALIARQLYSTFSIATIN